MSKKQSTNFGIFTESVGLYFSNFDKFIKYMSFPVLGQIAGLLAIFIAMYFYSINLPKFLSKYPDTEMSILIGLSILIVLPGLAIFCKAFWEYLIAYGAVNSMVENLVRSGKVYDFEAHNELIKRRTVSFIGLWFLFGIFSLIAACPLFWVICAIFAIYFVLIFQVFTFEPELSPIGCAKKSLKLIKGSFAQTLMLFVLIGSLTYILIPQIIVMGFDGIGINLAMANAILPFVGVLPELDFSNFGLGMITHKDMAIFAIQTAIAQILIQYTLPMRSILWSLWYKELNDGLPRQELPQNKKRTNSKKRPSEKLMENTRKKYSKKKLDDNILRRAAEKDDEE